jgi:NlpC/P60 family putative phage cell wall peptidase
MPNAEDVVAEARRWIGTPYHHQASVFQVGSDCLGLVRGVYAGLYGSEPETPPPYSKEWGEYDAEELMLNAATRHLTCKLQAPGKETLSLMERTWMAGDVLFFRARIGAVAKHCGISSGNGLMIHAYSGVGVVETDIGVWSARLAGVFSFPGI